MDRFIHKFSAGTVILSLVPGDEKAYLVFNKMKENDFSTEKINPETGEIEIIPFSFVKPAGFGTPFGKEDPEDGGDRIKAALRETLEETGGDVIDRLVSDVSYTEQPNKNSPYSNTVYLANGVGFSGCRPLIADEGTDPKLAGFYKLAKLPKKQAAPEDGQGGVPWEAGIYQAADRRVVATLLQLKPEHLRELGRPNCESADDLALAALDIPYKNLFSIFTIRMFLKIKREDILLSRLRQDRGAIRDIRRAQRIGRNLILWFEGKNLTDGLNLLLDRTRLPRAQRHELESFFADQITRAEKRYLLVNDRMLAERLEGEYDEHTVVETEGGMKPGQVDWEADYVKEWLGENASKSS